ncbi:short-chain dehydrogenase [Colletotrichum nymphaeae SA-01]|uniref:Short-chain dehydrogenase n=1 Tax=Colletotrichum nymphaeae SA-01 TaxID=1460502 RepID=A0A135TUT1_9PEZI|nr:short-chain dehydrogenase [Colletotrichum nymphaeae SA-01]
MLSSHTYLVTGASRGIGKGFVTALLQRPSTRVIASVRDLLADSSKALRCLDRGENSTLILIKIDSSIDEDPATAIELLQKEHNISTIDTIIANAGISHTSAPIRDISSTTALDHVKINSIAPLLLFSAAAPLLMNSKKPMFVAVSSVIGSISMQDSLAKSFPPSISTSPYGASKAMLNWYVKRLGIEEAWVTALVLNPGLVETDMSAELAKNIGVPDIKSMGAITVKESVAGMVRIIDHATKDVSGGFKNFDGVDLSW